VSAPRSLAPWQVRLAEAVARRRITIGFACGVLALVLARPTRGSLAFGAPLALLGEGIRLWASGHLEKSREVTASGPYRWTRHPLYVGSTLLGCGLAIASNSLVVAILAVLYLGITLTAAARSEERHLEAKFGEAYARYREGAGAANGRRFSLARVRRNGELRTLAGVALVLAYLFFLSARSS